MLAACLALPVHAAQWSRDQVAAMVYPSARATLADVHVDSYMPDVSLADTLDTFLGIPGAQETAISGHYALIDGCRVHSCDEKAAVIVDLDSRAIAALALRNFECRNIVLDDSDLAYLDSHPRVRPRVACNGAPVPDVYIVRRSTDRSALSDERDHLARLRAWGQSVGYTGERVRILVRYPAPGPKR